MSIGVVEFSQSVHRALSLSRNCNVDLAVTSHQHNSLECRSDGVGGEMFLGIMRGTKKNLQLQCRLIFRFIAQRHHITSHCIAACSVRNRKLKLLTPEIEIVIHRRSYVEMQDFRIMRLCLEM